jgi:hypothetical protein
VDHHDREPDKVNALPTLTNTSKTKILNLSISMALVRPKSRAEDQPVEDARNAGTVLQPGGSRT